ncbi:MAG: sensor histidine kinase [Anaerolineales bacterium]|nr:sensor histidine kinase [Anaerolineales bacterium]
MSALTDFFLRNIVAVYFFYGLSFFSMGLAIFLEVSHSSELDFARALRPLAAFGLLHGGHEWFEMLLLLNPEFPSDPANGWIWSLRLLLLAISFLALVAFGARLIVGVGHSRLQYLLMLTITAIWGLGLAWVQQTQPADGSRVIAADVYTRYALAIPGAILAAWGLILQCRRFKAREMHCYGNDVALAALAFALYGLIGQLFATPSAIFPSAYLNADIFVRWFGFPVQVFRATTACFAAIFIIRSLRAFEEENKRRIETLREAQQAERRRLEAIRAELLRRTVKAQESERQRIARELHDEIGQTLTALGMGLRGLAEKIDNNPQRAIRQAKQLETLAMNGLEELQRMVTGLHPPQLDDLGLTAALRWYANEIAQRYELPVNVSSKGNGLELSADARAVLFRIAQEAITNIVRHAAASQASIILMQSDTQVILRVEDDGRGFNVDETLSVREGERPCWGLRGIMERAALVGGQCEISSRPGQGTCVEVRIARERKDA